MDEAKRLAREERRREMKVSCVLLITSVALVLSALLFFAAMHRLAALKADVEADAAKPREKRSFSYFFDPTTSTTTTTTVAYPNEAHGETDTDGYEIEDKTAQLPEAEAKSGE